MTLKRRFGRGYGVSRRTVLTAVAGGIGTVAGCLGGTDEPETETEDEISERDRNLAAEMIDTIDAELSVTTWELPGMLIPEYTDSHGVTADASILGSAYVDIVEQGFDRRAMPTALTEAGDIDFMVFLEPEWANAYLEGEWSEAEYYAEIENSEH